MMKKLLAIGGLFAVTLMTASLFHSAGPSHVAQIVPPDPFVQGHTL
jgi:hypothetical protein